MTDNYAYEYVYAEISDFCCNVTSLETTRFLTFVKLCNFDCVLVIDLNRTLLRWINCIVDYTVDHHNVSYSDKSHCNVMLDLRMSIFIQPLLFFRFILRNFLCLTFAFSVF